MGGAELNKFRGAVECERDEHEPTPVAAYFISLGGFTETAIEQEKKLKTSKSQILFDSNKIITELINARIVIDLPAAAEKAGRCAENLGLTDTKLDGAELLGHKMGYIWAIFYAQGKQRSHFALIHADGTPLGETSAQKVIAADKSCKGKLYQYTYLAPAKPQPDKEAMEQVALAQYQKWVSAECGQIQLDGIPADAELSAYKLKLERLFVPLKVEVKTKDKDNEYKIETLPVGLFLRQKTRFSLLTKPGGGKSTLLKRLTVAYAEPERLKAANDQLPDKPYLPLLLRCRDLQERARNPILELLKDLSKNACMDNEQTSAFIRHVNQKLRSGQVLLLIDGLDEISDEGTRTAFAGNLRSFLAMFPQVAMIATSREAGYRHVAGVIASSCTQVTMASFDKSDVKQLCESWHVEVVGDKQSVRDDALKLAEDIWDNTRVRSLAENPLMLTTLLVIRRCIGELPTRRVELYRQSVEVLIRTWNTEGFEPMDLDEALTQLSYVACAMMQDGIQQVGHKQLVKWLKQSRKELDAELGYTKLSPEEFIKRIEYRSSLLMQTGHERIDGELQAVYEFRHLTFQEYLTARGFIEQQYPGWEDEKPLLELLEPHLADEGWKEVIPLAAVLAKRKAGPLIEKLTDMLRKSDVEKFPSRSDLVPNLLLQCLLDEVQISSSHLKQALQQIARNYNEHNQTLERLLQGKFGDVVTEVVESLFFDMNAKWDEYHLPFSIIAYEDLMNEKFTTTELYQNIIARLTSSNLIAQCKAALICMEIAYNKKYGFYDIKHNLNKKLTRPPIQNPLFRDYSALIFALLQILAYHSFQLSGEYPLRQFLDSHLNG